MLWEAEKRKSSFTWENKNRRHDPFAVHGFGENVDRVVAPTTRENLRVGSLRVMGVAISEEDKDDIRSPKPSNRVNFVDDNLTGNALERKKAASALEEEKKQIYNELKSSLGEAEANVHIKEFMVSYLHLFLWSNFSIFAHREALIRKKWLR